MSSKQSDENKLLASIQKTRSGQSGKPPGKPVSKKSTRKAAKKKQVSKTVVKKSADKTPRGFDTRNQRGQLVDLFQSGRRVWPD